MAKKAAAPATITLKHLAAALAEEHDLSKKAAEAILTDMVGKIAKHLKKGERIRIVYFGRCDEWLLGHFYQRGGSSMATAPAAKKSAPTVTMKHLAATLAEEHQLTKKGGEALLTDLVGLITKHLKRGERIRIVGLGILQVRKRAARMGRNPQTGEPVKIKASKKIAFRAAKDLKDSI